MKTWPCSPWSTARNKILLGEIQRWCIRIQIKWWKNGGQWTTSLGMAHSKNLCLLRQEPLSTSQGGRSGKRYNKTLRSHKTRGLVLCTKSKKKLSTASDLLEGKCPGNWPWWVVRDVGQPRYASWKQGHQVWCYPLRRELPSLISLTGHQPSNLLLDFWFSEYPSPLRKTEDLVNC